MRAPAIRCRMNFDVCEVKRVRTTRDRKEEKSSLSSKFYICPRNLASWPNIHTMDNLLAANITSRHTSRLKSFFISLTRHVLTKARCLDALPNSPNSLICISTRAKIHRSDFKSYFMHWTNRVLTEYILDECVHFS